MIAGTPVLHLLVALSMAASPVDPSACAADDLQCSAPAFAAAARRARSNAERVEYLYFANRAYLALSSKSPEAASTRNLCKAKQLIDRALALPATQLRERVVESRRVTLSRITEKQVECRRPRQGKNDDAPLVARANADPPAELLAPVRGADRLPAFPESPVLPKSPAAVAQPGAENAEAAPPTAVVRRDPMQRPPETASRTSPMGPTRTRTATMEGESRGHPGRRLLIGGGVSLAAGLALMGVAGYAGARALDARRTGHESMDLEATSENLMRNMRLEDEYRRLGPTAIVTGIAGGAAVVAAIVMLSVGARRRARAADAEPMLMPVRTGLLFKVHF